MKSKKQLAVRKPSKKTTASRRVRSADATIADSGAIRFGGGMAPASLRK